ncbi:MAG TPA: hypothetical protein VGH53_12095 [Streptosporangiaceae bacterium]
MPEALLLSLLGGGCGVAAPGRALAWAAGDPQARYTTSAMTLSRAPNWTFCDASSVVGLWRLGSPARQLRRPLPPPGGGNDG